MITKKIFFLVFFHSIVFADVWINASEEKVKFWDFVNEREDIRISQHILETYDSKKVDQSLLLDRINQWSKTDAPSQLIEKEFHEFQNEYTLSPSNRLILFEYFKSRSDFKLLCHIYANDPEIKSTEPFFDAGCSIKRISLKELNPNSLKYDYLLVDGNKINIFNSPYFYSTGGRHHLIFISDRFATQKISGDIQKIKKTSIPLIPLVDGTCEDFKDQNVDLSAPVHVYFSKNCTPQLQRSESTTWSFIKRNRYTLITTTIFIAAAIYFNSQYELGVTLP